MLSNLEHERVKAILDYDSDTGVFRWRVSISRRVRVGEAAGSVGSHGYMQIQIDGKLYLAHRLAWFWMTGGWPPEVIDHANLNRVDNAWRNLRLASAAQNAANQTVRRNSRSGRKGVWFDSATGLYRGAVVSSGKRQTISGRDQAEVERRVGEIRLAEHGAFARL